jgi:hypothetical protein
MSKPVKFFFKKCLVGVEVGSNKKSIFKPVIPFSIPGKMITEKEMAIFVFLRHASWFQSRLNWS